MKTLIFTILPFYSSGNEVFTNDIKSFTNYDEAYECASNNWNSGYFDIIENELN